MLRCHFYIAMNPLTVSDDAVRGMGNRADVHVQGTQNSAEADIFLLHQCGKVGIRQHVRRLSPATSIKESMKTETK